MLVKRVSKGDELDTAEEATFALSAAHERNKKQNRESYKSKLDDRKVLEKCVSNGDKLTTADEEATLSKLSAAHERNNKQNCERLRRKRLKMTMATTMVVGALTKRCD